MIKIGSLFTGIGLFSPTRNARLHALGNAIVPQLVALRFGSRIAEILRSA